MSDLIYLGILLGLIWFWLDSRRAHEFAVGLCRHVCDKNEVLLLDDTIALSKIRLRRTANGRMHFERYYRFEYSFDVTRREQGQLLLHGLKPVEIYINGQRTYL